MRAALAVVAVLCLGACAASDPCAGWAEVCVGLRVNGELMVDQLEIELSDGVDLSPTRTPSEPGPARALPVSTALHLRDVTGQARLRVTGLLGGRAVGRALQTLTFFPGRRQVIDVALVALGGEVPDGAGPPIDLGGSDGPSAPGRRVFLLPAASGNLGDLASVRARCALAGAALGGSFVPLLGYSADRDPATTVPASAGETPIYLAGTGIQVATFATLLAGPLRAPIDRFADGTPANRTCIWTNFDGAGRVISANDNCGADDPPWSRSSGGEDGIIRDPIALSAAEWTAPNKTSCDTTCHVLCLEE